MKRNIRPTSNKDMRKYIERGDYKENKRQNGCRATRYTKSAARFIFLHRAISIPFKKRSKGGRFLLTAWPIHHLHTAGTAEMPPCSIRLALSFLIQAIVNAYSAARSAAQDFLHGGPFQSSTVLFLFTTLSIVKQTSCLMLTPSTGGCGCKGTNGRLPMLSCHAVVNLVIVGKLICHAGDGLNGGANRQSQRSGRPLPLYR